MHNTHTGRRSHTKAPPTVSGCIVLVNCIRMQSFNGKVASEREWKLIMFGECVDYNAKKKCALVFVINIERFDLEFRSVVGKCALSVQIEQVQLDLLHS